MIVTKAHSPKSFRRGMPLRAGAIGLAVGMLSALGGVHAAQPVPALAPVLASMQGAAAPAGQRPATVAVSNVDFRRGEGGAGKLVLRFDGEGALPDLRTQGSEVVVNIGNASLPASLQRPLNVVDFATPVQRIEASQGGDGARVVLSTRGGFESMAYQTGRDYIVEIVPRTAVAERAVGSASAAVATTAQSGAARGAYSGRPVTFNFQDVPVRTVLQLIAEESNLNIVASDTVQGNVTLRLINVPWDQALDLILQARQLDKRRNGNVVWVAPQTEIASYEQNIEDARLALEERAETVTEYIPISYGVAEDIAKLLTEESKTSLQGGAGTGGAGSGQRDQGFLSSRGSLSFDRRTNTLLVIDIPRRVAEIKRLVTMLDKPVDQVVIEARIVIASETFSRDIGARFGVGSADSRGTGVEGDRVSWGGSLGGGGGGRAGGLNWSAPAGAGAGSLAFTILGNAIDWDVELSALQEEGRGEVISNPRIVTSNQREALISQGREVGYLTVTGGQSNSIPTVEFKDILLVLKVTPTITADGRVFLSIDLEKNELEGFVPVGQNGSLGSVPEISRRQITTAVLIEDGQTVSIGGVYEFRDRRDLSKVPFLGDLPILGNLFKKRGRNTEKGELLIFVTPKVLPVAQR